MRLARPLATAATAALCCGVAVVPLGAGYAVADPGDPGRYTIMEYPNTDACPYREHVAAPVDTSEVPLPGSPTPTALPVPTTAVGGPELAHCGVILPPGAPKLPPRISSAGFLVADATSGKVLIAKDPHGRYRPASTIKVLLALVALRDLSLRTVVTSTPEDYAMEGDAAGMGPNGHYTVEQLLSGLLLVSGNDCANALSRELGGHDATLEKMNALAKSLGATDTRAASPSGLDAAGMSTSPYDEALIFHAALQNPEFLRLARQQTAYFPGYPAISGVSGSKPHKGYLMGNQNQTLFDDPTAVAGKTGYTDDARKTFVGAFTRGTRTLILVQMYGWNRPDASYWAQGKALVDYAAALPPDSSVGELVSATGTSTSPSTTQSPTPGSASTAPQAAQDQPPASSSHGWGYLGVGIAAVIVAAAIGAWVVIRRRAQR